MKKIFLIIISLIALLGVLSIHRGGVEWAVDRLGPVEGGGLLTEGEELTFSGYYLNLLPVATLSLRTRRSVANYRELKASAETGDLISKVCRATAVITSLVERSSMQPIYYTEELTVTGKDPEIKEIRYDQDELVMEHEGVKRKIFPRTYGPISLLYYLRTAELVLGKEFKLNLNTNQENYYVDLSVVKDREVGEYRLWMIRGKFGRHYEGDERGRHRHMGSFTIWMTQDELRLPVLIKARTPAGPASIRLTKYGVRP